ncbi:MAG: alpha/beta hydrolase, partial [Erythrobacter sp.]|nr:alpha/beta hydrolase [Erythrobacter sp.]
KHDAFFPETGAHGYRRHLHDVDFNILETGHFALEEDGAFVAAKIRAFLKDRGIK